MNFFFLKCWVVLTQIWVKYC